MVKDLDSEQLMVKDLAQGLSNGILVVLRFELTTS